MGDFLRSYKHALSYRNVNEFSHEQLEELNTVLSAVVVLLRRHSIDNQLCCHNDVNRLQVTGVDDKWFVTKVRCKECGKTMDTTCYDANWTKEIIHNETQLRVGDHICWHRPCAIWHHAIVTALNPIKVIHYNRKPPIVIEDNLSDVHSKSSRCCDYLYRIQYEDCYNADYTVLRARKQLRDKGYSLLDRNCEHFSTRCKTGLSKSSQVSVCWASLGKMVVTLILKIIALTILGVIQWSQEESEQICQGNSTVTSTVSTVTKSGCIRNVEAEFAFKVLSSVYIVVVTLIFVIYLVVTSGKRLGKDPEDSPFNCFGRPCTLVCGVFCRVFTREIPGMIVTIVIVVHEDEVSDRICIQKYSDETRATLLILFIAAMQVCCYIIFALIAR